MSKIPAQLKASIVALLVLTGLGGGSYYVDQAATAEAQQNQYIQAVAADPDMPDGMRIAMVMAAFYESSNRHIGTSYVDKLGKGQPLTVCNGLTGKDVVAGKWYSPAECFRLEKKRYVQYEQIAKRSLTYWGSYNPFQQATFYDFLHNKGDGNFQTSTMRRVLAVERTVNATYQGALNDAIQKQAALQAAADRARRERDGLRKQLSEAEQRLADASPAALIEYARALSRVFGQCSQRYTELAIRADGHATDAATCRAAWPVIPQTKETQ